MAMEVTAKRDAMVVRQAGQSGTGTMYRRWFDTCLHNRPDCPRISGEDVIAISEGQARSMMGCGWYPCAVCAPGLFW